MTVPVLSLDGLTLCYGPRTAVRGLSLEVHPGEVFGLLGPNGCGKSTTLAAVVGAHRPAAGSVRVAGRAEADDPLAYRRLIGLVPQELALYDDLSARAHLTFFGRLYGLRGPALDDRADEVLHFVRLREYADRPPRTFSGGMKRRLNLACALLHRPPLLLLDEPTVGIDIQSRDAIFAALRDLAADGTGLVFTTHHLEEAEQLCDRVGIMDGGRLVAEAAPAGWCGGLERLFLSLTGRSLRES